MAVPAQPKPALKPQAPLILAGCLAAALERWQCLKLAEWLEVEWYPEAEPLPGIRGGGVSIANPVSTLPDQILDVLAAMARRARLQGRLASVRIRCWRQGKSVRLEFWAEPTGDVAKDGRHRLEIMPRIAAWEFCYTAQDGGPPRRRRRVRLLLPADPSFRSETREETSDPVPMCLVTCQRQANELNEQFRGLQRRLPFSKLWTTSSWWQAQLWLAHHPGCPLLAVEEVSEAGHRVRLSVPAAPLCCPVVYLNLPVRTTVLLAATRKISFCLSGIWNKFHRFNDPSLACGLLKKEQTKWRNLERAPD